MEESTQTAAIERINQILAEETSNYSFDLLRERFKDSYFNRDWTIKIPSGSELEFDEADVLLALFGESSSIWKLYLRRTSQA